MKEYRFYLTYNSVTTEVFNIDGWDNIGKEFHESPTYHTCLRSISAKLRFLNTEGGKIIQQAYLYDINSIVTFRVDKRNHITNGYGLYYTAIVDFKPESFSIGKDFTECNLIDSSKENMFKVNEDVNFNLFSRTAVNGVTVPVLSSEVQAIEINVPDIYLETIGTAKTGNIEILNYEINGLIDEIQKDYKEPIEGVWTPAYERSRTESVEFYDEVIADIADEIIGTVQIDDSVQNIFARVAYDTEETRWRTISGGEQEWTPPQRDRYDVYFHYNTPTPDYVGYAIIKESIYLSFAGVDYLLCERTENIIQQPVSEGSSIYKLYQWDYLSTMQFVDEKLLSSTLLNKEVEVKAVFSVKYKGVNSINFKSYPLLYLKVADQISNPQYIYLNSPVFTKDENLEVNKIGTNGKLLFKNEVYRQVDIDLSLIGNFKYDLTPVRPVWKTASGNSQYIYFDSVSLSPEYLIYYNIIISTYSASNVFISSTTIWSDSDQFSDNNRVQKTFAVNESHTISLQMGEYCNLEFGCVINSVYKGIDINASLTYPNIETIDIVVISKIISTDTITVRGLYLKDAIYRAIQLATGETNASQVLMSDILTIGDMKDIFVTNGYLLRNFPSPKLNCSVSDLFKTADIIGSLSMLYDRTNSYYRIEARNNAYSLLSAGNLGEVKGLNIKMNPEKFFNKVTIGNEKKDYEYLRGANEYNDQYEYSINVPVKNELQLIQPYRTDTIGIVIQLLNQYSSSSSLDLKGDNDVFFIKCASGNPKTNSTTWTGFLGVDSYYNGEFNPKTCLLKHSHTLYPQFKRLSGTNTIRFVNSLKPKDVLVNSVSLHSNLLKSQLDSVLLLSETYEFQASVSNELIEIINLYPNKYLEFSYNNVNFEGWIISLERSDYKGVANIVLIGKEVVSGYKKLYESEDVKLLESGNKLIVE